MVSCACVKCDSKHEKPRLRPIMFIPQIAFQSKNLLIACMTMMNKGGERERATWIVIVPGQAKLRMYRLAVESVAAILGVKLWKLRVPS